MVYRGLLVELGDRLKRIMNNYLSFVNAAPRRSRYCPAVWDKVLCWPPIQPGSLTSQACPSNQHGLDSTSE
ncbi:unnamed protein product [Nezara viridula]|uniref:G-protein coupled receptors family 2 profile 1 domain-containing protein n=1 Tax=Nezara viridula TaxID=85310 RepID=A0A9P0EIW9_NEZVI|nr:unnamed protein product [Nezara viridula]